MERTFPATDEAFHEASAFVEGELEKAGASMRATVQIIVAFEEIFVNIAHYAYPDVGTACLDLEIVDGVMTLKFKDSGTPFDPLAKDDPDLSLPIEERGVGGLGIYMVKKTMDEVRYEYVDGMNVLTIVKSIA